MLSKSEFDVLIFGGGPAGISAAIWADELGLSSALVDRGPRLGGQLHNVHNAITNYPGAEFQNGAEMSEVLERQIARRSTKLLLDREVVAVDAKQRILTFSDGETISGRSLILATGVRRRELGVPGEREFIGKGILDSGAKNPKSVAGKTVAIIGGGDSALENALTLAEYAERVILIHRRSEYSARTDFVARVREDKRIEHVLDSEAAAFSGAELLSSISVRHNLTGVTSTIIADRVLVRIGFQPNSELFKDQIGCDDLGYVVTDGRRSTNTLGVFAVGDVCRRKGQTIASAVGDGSAVIESILLTQDSS